MGNLQYVGARYVPKFYENSLDPSSCEWENGVAYEPLTVVMYNDDSYTSKKPVPGNIGNPASNPAYWAKTGNYNAAVANLQNDVDILKDNMTNLHSIFINVKDYGAKGDGLTNDYAAINDALNDAKALQSYFAGNSAYRAFYNNITVVFPAGLYLSNNTLTIPANISVIGAGINATTIKFTANIDVGVRLVGEDISISQTNPDHESLKVTIKGLSIDGNYKVNHGLTNYDVTAWLEKSVFEDLYITQCNESCLNIRSCFGSIFRHIFCECAAVPVIFCTNSLGSGFNGNVIESLSASNFSLIGIFTEAQNCRFSAINVDRAYDYKYTPINTSSININGDTYTDRAGIYITKTTDTTTFDTVWFEWLYNGTYCPCYWVENIDRYSDNLFKAQTVKLFNTHLGTENSCVYRIKSGIVCIDGLRADLTIAHYTIDTDGAESNTSITVNNFTSGQALYNNRITLPYGAMEFMNLITPSGERVTKRDDYNESTLYENGIQSFTRYNSNLKEYHKYYGSDLGTALLDNGCFASAHKVVIITGGQEDSNGFFDLGFKAPTNYRSNSFTLTARNNLAENVLQSPHWVQAMTLSNDNIGIRLTTGVATPITIPNGAIFTVTIDYSV